MIKEIKFCVACGMLLASVYHLGCDGNYCSPVTEPDLPAKGGFQTLYQRMDSSMIYAVSAGTATVISSDTNQLPI